MSLCKPLTQGCLRTFAGINVQNILITLFQFVSEAADHKCFMRNLPWKILESLHDLVRMDGKD